MTDLPDTLRINDVVYMRSDKYFENLRGSLVYGMDMKTIYALKIKFAEETGQYPTSPEQIRKLTRGK